MKNNQKKIKLKSNDLMKLELIKSLETLYVDNFAMRTDIDSYNYGINSAINKVKESL